MSELNKLNPEKFQQTNEENIVIKKMSRREKSEYFKTKKASKKRLKEIINKKVFLYDYSSYALLIEQLIENQLEYFKKGNNVMSDKTGVEKIISELDHAQQLFKKIISYEAGNCFSYNLRDDEETYKKLKASAYLFLAEHVDDWWD